MARVLICEPHGDIGALLELVVRRLGHEPITYDEEAGTADLSAFDAAVIDHHQLIRLGEVADVLLTGQYVEPRRATDAGFRFRFTDVEPALRDVVAR